MKKLQIALYFRIIQKKMSKLRQVVLTLKACLFCCLFHALMGDHYLDDLFTVVRLPYS